MVARLTRVEVLRVLRRIRFWLPVLLFGAGLAAIVAGEGLNPRGVATIVGPDHQLFFPHEYATGVLTRNIGALLVLALILPIVVSDTFPNDRRTRYIVLLGSRGATRGALVLSRVLAGAVVSMVAVAVTFSLMLLAALLTANSVHGDIGVISSFLPDLLDSRPALYFFIILAVFVVALTGVLSMSALAGALSSSWLVAVLAPPFVLPVSLMLPLPESLEPYSLGARASSLLDPASWATLHSTILYWLVFCGLCTLAGILAYRRAKGP